MWVEGFRARSRLLLRFRSEPMPLVRSAFLSPVPQPDWTIKPGLILDTHVDKVVLRGPINIDITQFVRGPIQNQLNGKAHDIEAQVAKALNLRQPVERIWEHINSVHKLSDSPPTWLRVTPKRVLLTVPLWAGDDRRHSGPGFGNSCFHPGRAPVRESVPLPNLVTQDSLPDDFDVSLPVEVPYDVLNRELNKQLSQKPIELPDSALTVSISGASIEPSGDGIILSASFQARRGTGEPVSGKLSIAGKTKFDPANAELRFELRDFTAESKNELLKSADWLGNSQLPSKIQIAAVVSLSGVVDKANQTANEQLNALKKQLPKEVAANISVVPGIAQLNMPLNSPSPS